MTIHDLGCAICHTKRNKSNGGALQNWKRTSQVSMSCNVRVLTLSILHIFTYMRLSAQHDSNLIKLSNAETQIEDLKLQLDDALGAEDMLVQLTERNLMLGEVITSIVFIRFFNIYQYPHRKLRKCESPLRTSRL